MFLQCMQLASSNKLKADKIIGKWKAGMESHPSAKAPDHCRRKPRRADMKMADELLRFHLYNNTPGGSKQGIRASKKKTVTGVVFHINLQSEIVLYLCTHELHTVILIDSLAKL